ncbi:MAG TPA: signal recognition particle receptor subunit alpha, partial [Acidimicrobiales bacterium]|nr:signal recognition particle receptor subunit alpha [Acidimicrobiales bacterium]
MIEILLIVLVVVVVAGVATAVAVRSRRPSGELEPGPPAPRGGTTVLEPPPSAPEAPPEPDTDLLEPPVVEAPPVEAPPVEAPPVVAPSFRERLGKARAAFSGALGSVLGRSGIDDDTWDDLEEALLRADVGVGPTMELLDHLRERVRAEAITEPAALLEALKQELKDRLAGVDRSLRLAEGRTNVWLFVGVN